MISVNIIGTGNVAWHLAKAFASEKEVVLRQVAGRSAKALQGFEALAQETVLIDTLTPAQVTIIAVSDDAIAEVSEKIPFGDSLVVHTSGFTGMSTLSQKRNNPNRHGVFYPLQSFSKEDSNINFSIIPILIEAENEDDKNTLQTLAAFISNRVEFINSKERRQLHLAAVFANNFTNYLYTVSQEICEKNAVSFDLLHALIKKTASKAIHNGPSDSQTGPAKRGDTKVIATQRDLLEDTNHKKIYNTLTDALKVTYGKEL